MRKIRTDLAVEAHEYYAGDGKNVPAGINVVNEEHGSVMVTRVAITTDEGAKTLSKPCGNYITIESAGLLEKDHECYDKAVELLSNEIKSLFKANNIDDNDAVLVVGLGNWNITPDALGPKVISKLAVTRHIFEYMPDIVEQGLRPVAGISPGVLGTTGIETGEVVRGLSENIVPKVIIAIDALASRSIKRVGCTLQICDTGIRPGSGVGNKRKELSSETLKIPVIAIGVPTVVDAATIADDALDSTIDSLKKSADQNSEFYNMLQKLGDEERYKLIRSSLGETISNMIVTPKEIDEIIEYISSAVADGINKGLHSIDVNNFLN